MHLPKLFSRTLITSAIVCATTTLFAQEVQETPTDTLAKGLNELKSDVGLMKKLKLTGYIQPQFQVIDSAGAASFAGGNFAPGSDSRFTMRRGRIKFTYESGIAMYMLNTDWTEKGVNIRETYVRITDPWTKWTSLTMGMHQIRFGHDISFSSGSRETPERARMFQILFPTERDMQAFITIQAPKGTKWNFLKGEFAYMNGSGVAAEFDSHKDISGRFSAEKANKSERIKFGIGVSYLSGAWGQNRGKASTFNKKPVYNMETNTAGDMAFVADYNDTANVNAVVKREYIGADLQFSIDWPIGITTIRAEYIQGRQPGTSTSSTSFNVAPTSDLFLRDFDGASFYYIQNIVRSRHQLMFKYDWYDPNTKISGDQIGKSGTNTKAGDIKYTTIGIGYACRLEANVKLTLYYDMVTNEKTKVSGFGQDLKDNVFTARVQYKF